MARLCCGLFVLLLQAVGGLGSVAAAIDRSAAGPGADVANLGADVGESRHRCGGRARSFASLGCTTALAPTDAKAARLRARNLSGVFVV